MMEAQDRAAENMKKMQMEQRDNMIRGKKEAMMRRSKIEQALAKARARENTKWVGSALSLVVTAAIVSHLKTGSAPMALRAAAFPLTFATAYMADMGWGNKLNRIKKDAQEELTRDGVDVTLP